MHGIVWTKESYKTICDTWQYGYIWPRPEHNPKTYVNHQTINYSVKYITKVDFDHKYYTPIVLSSPGIGGKYAEKYNATKNKFNGVDTDETYRTTER